MNKLLLPAVREYRALQGNSPLPAQIACRDLPSRLDGTLAVGDLGQMKLPGKGVLPVTFGRVPAGAFCRRKLKPFQEREAYRLTVRSGCAHVEYESECGAFRALTTLGQFIRLHSDLGRRVLASAAIVDYPELEYRGMMYDFARNQVHRQQHVLDVVRLAIRLKATHINIYLEDHYQFPSLDEYRNNPHYMSPRQARELDDLAKANFLTLMPQTNCLGHNEGAVGCEIHRDIMEDGFLAAQVCPSRPATLKHLGLRLRDLAAEFSSPVLHVGGDEAWELGRCPQCRAFVGKHGGDKRGKGELYLRHLLAVRKLAARHGRRIAVWGDMIKAHPEIAKRVPRDVVIYDWIYGGSNCQSLKAFRDKGFEVVACGSDSSYESFGMNLPRCTDNIQALFGDAGRLGLEGGEITLWEMERGNFFHTSLFALAYACHFLWSGKRLAHADIARRISVDYFGADSPIFGRLLANLFGEIPANVKSGLLSAAKESPVPYLGYGAWDNLARMRTGLLWWTSEIPQKQSPFYHLIGLLTTPSFDPAFFARAAKGLKRARADLAALASRSPRNAGVLIVYEIVCQMYEFNFWMLERLAALAGEYHQAAVKKTRGVATWRKHLAGLVDFLTDIEGRYAAIRTLQREACRRYGHSAKDVEELGVHIDSARRFKRKILRLRKSAQPLPSYYRFLLEYPRRFW